MPNAGIGGAKQSLQPLVESLEDEIAGLRQSAQLRSVIEQAKGVLAERHGISLSEAFDRLRTISQQQNARLADVAATVLGLTRTGDEGHVSAALDSDLPRQMRSSPAMSASWRALRDRPDVRANAVGVVVESLAAVSEDGDAAAELMVELAGHRRPDGVLIYALRDDYLELVGGAGYPSEATTAWARVSLALDIPLTRPVLGREPLVVESSEAMLSAYPALSRDALYGYQCWLLAPVLDHSRVAGLVVMGWRSPTAVEDARQQQLLALVRRTGPVFLRTLAGREPAKRQLTSLLRLSQDPWMVVVPASPTDRAAEALVVEAVAPEVADSKGWAGRRLLAVIPDLADEGALLRDLTRLLEDDALFVLAIEVAGSSSAPWDARPGQLRVVRTGRRLVLTWRAY
jgi:hypothetical protein